MEAEVKLFKGGLAVDDRGALSFVNDFNFEGVKRFYMVENHRSGFIRAWHGHQREGKYIFVVSGSAIIGAVPLPTQPNEILVPYKFVLSAKSPAILWVPPMHANGFKSLEENTKILFFSTSTLEESKNDDMRFPYNQWNIWEEDFR
jgi:dTDP-4-dehydrorhamnose 3,5-epimerase-like enzyme